jgi:hypothetical protein
VVLAEPDGQQTVVKAAKIQIIGYRKHWRL